MAVAILGKLPKFLDIILPCVNENLDNHKCLF